MIGFAFASARLETPHGQTFVDIPVKVRHGVLYYHLDGVDYHVELQAGWSQASKVYGVQDVDGGEWRIKRMGGCGCG